MTTAKFESNEHHHAFKQGYRSALLNRPLHAMPSYIRGNARLRQVFEQGWQEAKDELSAGQHYHKRPYLRHRATWIIMTAIAGVATAGIMINEMTLVQKESRQIEPHHSSDIIIPLQALDHEHHFSLLDARERASLIALKYSEHQEDNNLTFVPLQPIHPSSIQATLSLYSTQDVQQPLPSDEVIPKFIRSVTLKLHIQQSEHSLLKLNWLWQRRVIHSEHLNVMPLPFTLQRDQALFSAWSGEWHIELLDPNDNVVYRYAFNYIN